MVKKLNTSFKRDRFFMYLTLVAALCMWIAALILPSIRQAIGGFDLLIALPFIVGGCIYVLERQKSMQQIQEILDNNLYGSQKVKN